MLKWHFSESCIEIPYFRSPYFMHVLLLKNKIGEKTFYYYIAGIF